MSTIKKYINKHKGYEAVSRDMLQDKENLSLQAIGLLAHIQSLPDTWTINKTELYKRFAKNGRTSVSNAWNELIENNYVLQFKKRHGKKWIYTYYFSHEKFSAEDIQLIEHEEQATVWNGSKTSSNKGNNKTESSEKAQDTGDSSNVDFVHPKMGTPKPASIKLDLKEINLKDNTETKDTEETRLEKSAITFSDTKKLEKQDQMLKNSLKHSEGLSERLFEILDTFSESYNQMYNWIGILFRAKNKAENNTGVLLEIEKKENDEMICNAVMTVIRNIRQEEKESPDGYMFTSLVKRFEQSIAEQARRKMLKEREGEYHYLKSRE